MAATDRNAAQDLTFEEARTHPPTDLLARVPLDARVAIAWMAAERSQRLALRQSRNRC